METHRVGHVDDGGAARSRQFTQIRDRGAGVEDVLENIDAGDQIKRFITAHACCVSQIADAEICRIRHAQLPGLNLRQSNEPLVDVKPDCFRNAGARHGDHRAAIGAAHVQVPCDLPRIWAVRLNQTLAARKGRECVCQVVSVQWLLDAVGEHFDGGLFECWRRLARAAARYHFKCVETIFKLNQPRVQLSVFWACESAGDIPRKRWRRWRRRRRTVLIVK